MNDASEVIEKTSREIEKEKDDQIIYAVHESETTPEITDLDDEEVADMLDEEGIQITEGDEDDGSVDLGEEF